MRNDPMDRNISITQANENATAACCNPECGPVVEDACCNSCFNIDSSLLFFFLILVCVFRNSGCGICCDTLLWFFLLLVVLMNKYCGCGCDFCC